MDFFKKNVAVKIAVTGAVGLLVVASLLCVTAHGLDLREEHKRLTDLFLLFSIVVSFFLAGLTVISVHVSLHRPLQSLNRAMLRVQNGSLLEKCEVSGSDELGELADNFNKMIENLHQINESRKQIEQRLIKAEESLKYKLALEDKTKIIERMNHELTSAFNDITLLYTVSQYLSTVLEQKELVSVVRKIFTERYSCDAFVLYFVESDPFKLKLITSKGILIDSVHDGVSLGIAGDTIIRRRSLYIADVQAKSDVTRSPIEQALRGAVFSVPLIVRDTVVGVLTLSRDQVDGFSPTDRQSLESIASQIAVAHDKCQLYSQTKEMSVRDELTGAYNRRHFQQALQQEFKRAKRFGRPVSLLMIDVDHFKTYNDTHGHLKGDELLKKLTLLLQQNIREVDLLARFGGEEFVVMLTDTNLDDAVHVANKLRKIVKAQLKLGDENLPADRIGQGSGVTVSIGASAYPECTLQPKQLINSADMALYLAKKDGRDLVRSAVSGAVVEAEELMA